MRALACLVISTLAVSCVPEANAAHSAPRATSKAVSQALGQPVQVPPQLAMLSTNEVVEIAKTLPSWVSLDAVQMVPGVGPAFVDSFTVNCDNTAAFAAATGCDSGTGIPSVDPIGIIAPPCSGLSMISYTCQNKTTVEVTVGDSSIVDPGGTENAPIYCSTNCPAQEFGGNARREYCRGDTDTTIACRALVSATSAP
jgi:hypothetical protein